MRYVIGLLGMQMAVPSYVYTWNGLGASGSLSAFILFYLFVPIYKKFISDKRTALYALVLSAILCWGIRAMMTFSFSGWGDSGKYVPMYSPQTNIWYFLIGVYLYFIRDDVKKRYILAGIVGMILAAKLMHIQSYSFYASAVAVVLCLYWRYGKATLPELSLVSRFNKIGYAFWLAHPIVLYHYQFGETDSAIGVCEKIDWFIILIASIVFAKVLTMMSEYVTTILSNSCQRFLMSRYDKRSKNTEGY